MLFFDHSRREKLRPPSLFSTEIEEARDQIDKFLRMSDERVLQTDPPPVWKIQLESDVLVKLRELSGNRCAFCDETRDDVEPYRFRPPAYAEPELPPIGKASYLWLTFAWSNFFPICPDCRPAKPEHFPVTGKRAAIGRAKVEMPITSKDEKAVLYYPGETKQFWNYADVTFDGFLEPKSKRAKATVNHFSLNRPSLVETRKSRIKEFFSDYKDVRSPRYKRLEEEELEEKIFGGDDRDAIYLFARRLTREISKSLDLQVIPASPNSVADSLHQLSQDDRFDKALGEAEEALRLGAEAETRSWMDSIGASTTGAFDPEHPAIKQVSVTTYKSLEEITFEMPKGLPGRVVAKDRSLIEPDAPCLMILGENATGKSSMLEAIAIACLSDVELDELVKRRTINPAKLPLNPEYMGAPGAPKPTLGTIQVSFHDERIRHCRVGGSIPEGIARSLGDEAPPLLFAYGAHRLFGKEERHGQLAHVESLFDDSRQLPNPESWLRRLWEDDRAALNEVASALRHIIQIDGEFEAIHFASDGDGRKICMLRMRRERRGLDGPLEMRVVDQPLSIVSSGYRAILALVCDILRGLYEAYPSSEPHRARMSRAIVLIDEIEAHLHPRWKLHIMTGLRRALPRVTLIVTSHDPLCVRGMFNGEVMALNRYENLEGDGLALPERVEQVAEFDHVETMTVDQLLTSDLFQLFSTDDAKLDREFAQISDILAKLRSDQDLTSQEREALEQFNQAIVRGLPFGLDVVTGIVQEAVAEFVSERRSKNVEAINEKRERAKAAVKQFLSRLVQ